ncbi:hypothetical protein OAS39_13255 [Pirellulales bacterium]|nr:hypothetical protein [Pirellulales bacterium]
MRSPAFALVFATLFFPSAQQSSAAPVQGGNASYEYYNSFTTRLFPGTPFNPGSENVDILVESTGVIKVVWQEQVGDEINFEIVSIVADGELPGEPPIPFQLLGGVEVTPQLGPFVGTYSQIVQDPNDPGFATGDPSSLVSAELFVAGPYAQVLADGTFLYGAAPYEFEASITGLPYPIGTEFFGTSASEVPIRLQLGGAPDPNVDPVIALALSDGYVRIDRVIPEPSGLLLVVSVFAASAAIRIRPFT